MIYDCVIIGRGLIGSAAAKYMSNLKENVLLIGPCEETVLRQQIIYASHYDRARIQRIFGSDSVFTLLNQHSANQYSSIEKESNVVFHSTEGCLYVNPYGIDSYLGNIPQLSKEFSINFQSFDSGKSVNTFAPDYHFPESSRGIFEEAPSGHINPRLLIHAQLTLFEINGGKLLNDTALEVSNENNEIKITTLSGKVFYSKQVLLTPGAFVNFFNLMKRKMALILKSETTIWAKTNANEASRLSNLPSLLYKLNEPQINDIYLIRPLQYPDRNFYLKMGANFPDDLFFKNLTEIQEWFKNGGNENNLKVMKDALKQLIPTLLAENYFVKKCIVSYTTHGKPYIGEVDKNLFVAVGGNGYAAMSSDALGKIAATLLINDSFPEEFFQEDFQPVFE